MVCGVKEFHIVVTLKEKDTFLNLTVEVALFKLFVMTSGGVI